MAGFNLPINFLIPLGAFHLFLLPLLCRHLPYSFYFNPTFSTTNSSRDEGNEEAAALDQLASLARREQAIQQHYSHLAVLVLTASRQGVSYLGRSLLALHGEVVAAKNKPLVFVCSGEKEIEKKFRNRLPFPLIQPNTSQPLHLWSPGNRKAKQDFVFCVDQMHQTLPQDVEHILILEDDTLVMQGFFSTLSTWMTFHQERLEAEPWLDIKLYLNPRLRGWAWDPLPLVELLSSTSFLAIVLHVILAGLRETRQFYSWMSFVLLWVSILGTLLLVGRQHWVQWRRIHPQLYMRREVPNPFTQAVLYPRQRLIDAALYMRGKLDTSTPFDLTLGQYRRSAGLDGHLLEPNLVRHIGLSSAFDAAHVQERDAGDNREFLAEYPI